jgi:glucose/arabinose dehydrogenase
VVAVLAVAPARAAGGLVAAYGFDEGTGTAVADASGTGNSGTVSGTTWAAGKSGGALSFNGSSSSVTVPDSPSLDLTTGMTLEAWVNPTATTGSWRTVLFKQSTNGMVYALYANDGNGRPAGQVNIGGERNAVGLTTLPLNTWSHLAVTYDAANLRLFVNGTQVAAVPQTGAIPASTGALRLGGNSIWGEWFRGLIDDARVYNRALGAAEIQADMATPVSATPPPPAPRFVNDKVIVGLDEPTDVAFLPGGRMLIAERDGTVSVVQPGATRVDATPFLQLSDVSFDYERGLLGLTVDPDFANNPYVYVYWTNGATDHNRVSRFRVTGNTASGEVVVWQHTVDADVFHQGGGLRFGPDGYLYISVGDHLSAESAQDLTSFSGKILRVTRDGAIPAGNPFDDGVGPNKDAIWARGLRNPFRFTFDAVTGRMLIGDVGQDTWEEVDVGARGANFGWPACEGSCGVSGMTNPVYSYRHDGRDASITGGFVYRGSQFPAEYRGDYFFADYAQNWIKRMSFDASGNVSAVRNFEPADGSQDGPYGEPVALAEGPDGALYYVDTGPFTADNAGSIRRVRNVAADQPPTAVAAADKTSGAAPLTVGFSSAGSADPEGRPLTYRWDFGDGASSTAANPSHTFTASGRYTVRLTTSDGALETVSDPLTITAGSAPTARILTPADGRTFRAGDTISYSGSASDAEDGTLPASALSWTVAFHHEGHLHPYLDGVPGSSGTFAIPSSGHSFSGNTSYDIVLTATDSDGIKSSASVTIRPEKSNLTLATTPSGLTVTVDGIAVTGPTVRDELIGFRYAVDAPTPQFVGGSRYDFVSWSDGGAKAHTVTVGASAATLTARFQLASSAPPGLVAAYNFDEGNGGTLYDHSGKGHDGTLSGPIWAGGGRTGGALSFDGVNDFVRIEDAADLDLTTGMTLEAWVRPSTLGTSWRTVLFKEQSAHMTYALYANTSSGRPTAQSYVGGERDARASAALPAGAWTHLAGTYDGTTVRLYVGGVQAATVAAGGAMTVSSGALKLGGNAIWNEWFAGLMDDVRIYNRALSAAEIQGDMGTPVTG